MIVLHHLGGEHAPFHLNPDLVVTVEAHPDTVVTLTTGQKMMIAESPSEVVEAIRAWRVLIMGDALARRRPARRPGAPEVAIVPADHSGR